MLTKFKKISYESNAGYTLHHTTGFGAADSTRHYQHTTSRYMLIYFVHGTGQIKIEGKHYDIGQGDMVIMGTTELYYCSVNDNAYHERIVLYFEKDMQIGTAFPTEQLYKCFQKQEKGVGNLIPADLVKAQGLDQCLLRVLDLMRTPSQTNSILAFSKILEFLALLNDLTIPLVPENRSQGNDLINKILQHINTHLTDNISISSIAAEFGIHNSYLAHLFKEHVGMSLWNYIILRRLHAFNEHVRNGSAIEEACWQVGFQNYSNFFRLYKKHMGMTPMQFKKQLKGKQPGNP